LEDLSLVVAAVSTPTVMKEAEEEMGIEENRGEQGDKEEKENK